MKTLRLLAILGNGFFILWTLYNGINEGFKATSLQTLSYIILWIVLAINIFLLSRQK
jgi:hypothetical protein